ncbi:MAG: FGGY-family carbohydrate kinase [Clostridia bacterium]|nr:FGGY-family carbohydrate kinase [Clostridia bacterium]
MRYYIGLDNGGTTTKAALFDMEGREICVHSVSTEAITPLPGFVERDMQRMWEANCEVIREVLSTSGTDARDIAAIAVCGHGKGLYLWGKDDKPVRNGIISTDNRAVDIVAQWQRDSTEDEAFKISCQHIMACQPVALLKWLKMNEPGVIENICWVFECKDYVRFRLTGEARAELTDYSGANLINLYERNYDIKLLELFGIPEIMPALPPLCEACEICGHVTDEAARLTGLNPGTPVAGGMFDIDACALAAGVLDEDDICMIAGTWSINEYLRREPVVDGKVLMNSLFCMSEYYLIEESSPTSAANNEWFAKTLLPEVADEAKKRGGSVYGVMNEWIAGIPADSPTPVFLPFLIGSNVNPAAMGAFIGLNATHTRGHMARAVYEGIAFSHRQHLEKLLSTRESMPRCVRLAGGAAKSSVWAQMFADVMKLPVETVAANETGALGCAMSAAVACGDYASLYDAAKAMCRVTKRFEPDEAALKAYDGKYDRYQRAIKALDAFW